METREHAPHQQINQELIGLALKNLLHDNPSGNLLEAGVELSQGAFRIVYQKKPFPRSTKSFTVIVSLSDSLGKAAFREFRFSATSGRSFKVGSVVKTMPAYQSNGYGAGLMMSSDIVIVDALSRFPELEGKHVTAEIIDNSGGKPVNGAVPDRTKWSSYFAQRLGYTCVDPEKGLWRKVYQ